MTVTPHYTAGAITLTPGETTFTLETGALLANAKAGDMVIVEGQSAVGLIASITDNTEGELEFAWSGDAIAPEDSPLPGYRIKHVGPDWFTATTITIQQSRILERITAGGNLWETTGQPAADVGYAGDYAIDISGNAAIIYFKDPDNGWDSGVILVGNNTTAGTGVPDNGTGEDGDLYIRTTNGQVYVKASGSWTELAVLTGAAGPTGPAAAPSWTFSTTTTDENPGSGNVRFNHANIESVSKILLHGTMNGGSFAAGVQTWDDLGSATDRGSLFVFNPAAPTTWGLFRVTGTIEAPTSYRRVSVTRVASNPSTGAFASNGVTLAFMFVPAGLKGDTGAAGLTPGKSFVFEADVSGDPGAGRIRADNASFASITTLAIDDLDALGVNVEGWIQSLDDAENAAGKGWLILEAPETGAYMEFTVTGAAEDQTGYWTVAVTPIAGEVLADNLAIVAWFYPAGNDGTDGEQGVEGPASVPMAILYAYGDDAGGNDQYTKIMLHMVGDDASATFTDDNAGGSAHTWTAVGNAQIDTADSPFGDAAGLFDGSGDYVTTSDHADYVLGAGEWSIDVRFKCIGASGSNRSIASQTTGVASTSSFSIFRNTSNVFVAQVSNGSSFVTVTGTTQFTDALNTGWHEIALKRVGNVLKLLLDGVQEGGDVAFTGTVPDSTAAFLVGAGVASWHGWLGRFRLSVGTARWTASYAPLTHPPDTIPPPPDAGVIAFDNTDWSLASEIHLSTETFSEVDVAAWLATFDQSGNSADRGILIAMDAEDSSRFIIARVTGAVAAPDTDYRVLSITPIAAGDTPSGDDPPAQVGVQFIPAAAVTIPARLGEPGETVSDWDTTLANGWYVGIDAANAPEASVTFIGEVIRDAAADYIVQRLRKTGAVASDLQMWERARIASTWGDWYRARASQTELDDRYGLRTELAIAGPMLNPMSPDFGAAGDGTTNDDTAVQAVVAAAYSTGTPIFWPAGTYLTTVTIPNLHDVRHYGPGIIKRGANLFYVEPRPGNTNPIFINAAGSASNDGLSASEPFSGALLPARLANYGPVLSGYWEVTGAAGDYAGMIFTRKFMTLNGDGLLKIKGPAQGYPNVPTMLVKESVDPAKTAGFAFGWNQQVILQDVKTIGFSSSGVTASRFADLRLINFHDDGSTYGVRVNNNVSYTFDGGLLEDNSVGIEELFHVTRAIEGDAVTIARATSAAFFSKEFCNGHLNSLVIDGKTDDTTYTPVGIEFHSGFTANVGGTSIKDCSIGICGSNGELHEEDDIVWTSTVESGTDEPMRKFNFGPGVTPLSRSGWSGDPVAYRTVRALECRAFDFTTNTWSDTSAHDISLGTAYANEHSTQGQRIRVTIRGKRTVGSNGTVTVTLRLGGTTVGTVTLPTSGANAAFEVRFEVLCYADGDFQRVFAYGIIEGAYSEGQTADRTETMVANNKTVVARVAQASASDTVVVNEAECWA